MVKAATNPTKRAKECQPLVNIRPRYLARPDAAAFLAIPESTLDNLVARGEAPSHEK